MTKRPLRLCWKDEPRRCAMFQEHIELMLHGCTAPYSTMAAPVSKYANTKEQRAGIFTKGFVDSETWVLVPYGRSTRACAQQPDVVQHSRLSYDTSTVSLHASTPVPCIVPARASLLLVHSPRRAQLSVGASPIACTGTIGQLPTGRGRAISTMTPLAQPHLAEQVVALGSWHSSRSAGTSAYVLTSHSMARIHIARRAEAEFGAVRRMPLPQASAPFVK